NLFVDEAIYYDHIGDTVTASSIHNGLMPQSLSARYNLDTFEHVESAKSSSCSRIFWARSHSEDLVPPGNADKNRNTIFTRKEKNCPPEFLDILEDGSFVYNGMDKLFVDRRNVRIKDHSDINSYLSQRLAGSVSATATRLDGLTVLLVARNANNFYHWHFDILPVLAMLEACGVGVSQIDNIVVAGKPTRFQLDMLSALGVHEDQLYRAEPGYQHVVCDRLVMPRIHNSMGLRQPRKHIDWLRGKYLPKATGQSATAKKIAIMREQRGFDNQPEVEARLQAAGYESVFPERLSYTRQVETFANATHIVSPHGAALSLLAYCRPGTVVHEIYGEHVHPCFWSLSSTLGLKYFNYNCSAIFSEEITNGGRGLAERARKSIHVPDAVISQIIQRQ
ncbi:MAG: glycosyltransferase family 61 protein, partial [Pseudomonadota bacterium]